MSVLICRPVLEVERSVPRAVDAPFNRMQLWIFPSQRDNEVSSGAENEAVVCPGGHGAGGSKLNQVFVERGSISRDTAKPTIDRTPGGLLGNTFYLCQKIVHFHLRHLIT